MTMTRAAAAAAASYSMMMVNRRFGLSSSRHRTPLLVSRNTRTMPAGISNKATTTCTSSTTCLRSFSSIHVMDKLFNPTEEHAALRSTLRSFVEKEVEPQADYYNKHEKFNVPLFRKLGDLGLLGLTVDEKYGGGGMDARAVVLVHEELSYADPAFCLSYLAHAILLVHNLHHNACASNQLQRFLPDLISGQKIGGMGMSEASSGTDVLGMKTVATPHQAAAAADDDDNGGFTLSGTKMWITNGTLGKIDDNDDSDEYQLGDLFLVYARTGPQRSDITQFVVERGMDGFSLGSPIKDKLGMRASMTAELVMDQVHIPSDNVVGRVNEASICMMRNLEMERLALAAMALGIARRCLDEMKAYAVHRTGLFETPNLYAFGQVQQMIAESYANYMAGKSYVYALAQALDEQAEEQAAVGDTSHKNNGLDADGTKLYCAQMAKTVADHAIQVLGGNGYVAEYKVERLWRDAKLLEIGGGTNQSHHKNMARDLRRMGHQKLP